MTKPLRVFVDHGEAYGNLGDEAMLVTALTRLTRYLGPCEFVLPRDRERPLPADMPAVQVVPSGRRVFGDRVQRLQRRIGRLPLLWRWAGRLPAPLLWSVAARWAQVDGGLLRMGWRRPGSSALDMLRKTLQGCDVFYGVGAATLNRFNAGDIAYKCWLYREARRYVPLCAVSSQGFGPFQGTCGVAELRRTLDNLDYVSFRDCEASRTLIGERSGARVAYRVTGDEAFALPPAGYEAVSAYLRGAGMRDDEPYVAVHFRTTDYTRNTEDLLPKIAAILDGVGQETWRFLYIPMSYDEHSSVDQACGSRIKGLMRRPDRLVLAPFCQDSHVVKAVVGRTRFSLGLSYHLHVFSLSMGHPAVILYSGEYYRAKSEGLIGFYGAPNAALDLGVTGVDAVRAAIESVEAGYDAACRHIRDANVGLLRENDWILRQLAARLGRSKAATAEGC